eukprot:TRINITY_DN184_c0_g3_i1.p1 TRINITY_DN184_c0_g3~~TRINITY_DN184_c0_g3_i1.p1  ORF type:complete len:215 (+),score=69.50 TRINITY_DN184_c0_g3_i1:209-853(+)
MEIYKQAFSLFDKDKNGVISGKELGLVLRNLNQFATQAEIKDLIDELDENQNGVIDWPEFVNLMEQQRKIGEQRKLERALRGKSGENRGEEGKEGVNEVEEEWRQIFEVFDKDRNGAISSHELKEVMLSLGENFTEEEVDQMIKVADLDGDGQINFQEFFDMIKRKMKILTEIHLVHFDLTLESESKGGMEWGVDWSGDLLWLLSFHLDRARDP